MNGDIIGGETWSAVSNGGQDIGSSSTSGDHVSPAHSAKYISPHIGNISKGDGRYIYVIYCVCVVLLV